MTRATRYFDDNPATIDLLGFDAVVAPVVAALVDARLDPITVGVHAPWGAGKTTVLGLLEEALKDSGTEEARVVVVRTSPWRYDDHDDVKGNLMGEVLSALKDEFKADVSFVDRAKRLLDRIAWSRIGKAVASGAVTNQLDWANLVDAFRPVPEKAPPTTLAGFQEEFEEALDGLENVKRVVVLVDDLDRCLPSAVMGTLEAIKLFLSVKRMSFVIAADTRMVQESVARSLGESRRGERFAVEYLDKIVQLPVVLPTLGKADRLAYAALLLARHELDDDEYQQLVAHTAKRRTAQQKPYVGDFPADCDYAPSHDTLAVAGRAANGLGRSGANPRRVKRFLNNLETRQTVAEVRGVTLSTEVIAKLFLLEHEHADDFGRLLAWSDAERSSRIEDWESWARERATDTPPHDVTPGSAVWAKSEPSLVGEQLGAYLSLAGTLTERPAVAGEDVRDEVLAVRDELASSSEAVQQRGRESAAALVDEDRAELAHVLVDDMRNADQQERLSAAIAAAVALSEVDPKVAGTVVAGIRDNAWRRLRPGDAALIAGSQCEALRELGEEIANDRDIKGSVREAAKMGGRN